VTEACPGQAFQGTPPATGGVPWDRIVKTRSHSLLFAVAAGLAFAAAMPAPSQSSIGTGVGATPLQLQVAAKPGHRYRFPSLYVVNTGSQTSEYAVRVQQLGTRPGKDVPASWLRLGRTRLRLRPHKSAVIPVRLLLPRNVPGGHYRTDLVVGTSTRRPGHGAALGAAAADELSFTVTGTGGFPWTSPWLIYPLIGLLGLGLLISIVRRLGLRIEIEHRG
jgi:hypothetical protein